MLRRFFLLASVVALPLLAGCGSSTTEADPLTILSATFTAPSADPSAEDLASAVAGAAAGTIRVTGSIKLPAPCYDMSTTVMAISGSVVVHVRGDQQGSGCAAQLTQVSYDILIGGSSPGSHTVSVEHTVDTGRAAESTPVGATTVIVK